MLVFLAKTTKGRGFINAQLNTPTPTKMKIRTPSPNQMETAEKAGVTVTQVRRHYKGVQTSPAVMAATHSLCSDCADSNLADIMSEIHEGVSKAMIDAVFNIHAPIKDKQHRDYTTAFLRFLCEVQEAGRAVSFVRFYVVDEGWRMETIIDGLAWQVEAYNIDACKMWLGLMPFYGLHKTLAGVLSAMYNGLNE